MVRADSHELLLMSWYSGIYSTGLILFKYGTITLYGSAFQPSSSKNKFCNLFRCFTVHRQYTLQPSTATVPVRMYLKICSQRDRIFFHLRAEFRLIPFRSPLLRESQIRSLFFQLLRCFTSLACLPMPIYLAQGIMSLHMMGFPIRKSPDISLFVSYPRLIADYHVLHRLLQPRHPPYTLILLFSIFLAYKYARPQN
jgi:hypothetical protein